jgi:Flp pilus assembly protein TadB
MAGVIAAAAIAAAATITVGAMKDSTQRQKNSIELSIKQQDQRLKEMNAAQKHALEVRVANAKTDTERLAIYNETLSKLGTSTVTSTASILAAGVATKGKQNYLTNSIVLAGGILLVGGTLFIIIKKK